jgi:hypothetical protein
MSFLSWECKGETGKRISAAFRPAAEVEVQFILRSAGQTRFWRILDIKDWEKSSLKEH